MEGKKDDLKLSNEQSTLLKFGDYKHAKITKLKLSNKLEADNFILVSKLKYKVPLKQILCGLKQTQNLFEGCTSKTFINQANTKFTDRTILTILSEAVCHGLSIRIHNFECGRLA